MVNFKSDHKEKLQEVYNTGHLIPFIGAGLSAPFKIPTWADLIKIISNRFVSNDLISNELLGKIEKDISCQNYWGAIDKLKNEGNIGESTIQKEICEIVQKQATYNKNISNDAHLYGDLVNMKKIKNFLTTNYDFLLYECKKSDFSPPENLYENNRNTQSFFNGQSSNRMIWHLHGNTANYESIIISKQKYDELYSHSKYLDLFKVFQSVGTLLFMGFSFDDKYFKDLFSNNKVNFNSEHFIILDSPTTETEIKFLKEYNLNVIGYESENNTKHTKEIREILEIISMEDNNSPFKTLNSNDSILSLTSLQQKIKEYYVKNFTRIDGAFRNSNNLIDDVYINLSIEEDENQKEKEKKLKNKSVDMTGILDNFENIYESKQAIEIKDIIDKSKKALVLGRAGIGKTVLSKYIAYKWSKGELWSERFELVLYLPLRAWKENQGIGEFILNTYYMEEAQEYIKKSDIMLLLESIKNRCLIIFDGYDELSSELKNEFQKVIRKISIEHYIITSRAEGVDNLTADKKYEIIGFTDSNIVEYIEKSFEEDEMAGRGLEDFLYSNKAIYGIAHIPLMLELICHLWKSEAETIKNEKRITITKLYIKVIDNIFMNYTSIRGDNEVKKHKNEIYNVLGYIAFKALSRKEIIIKGENIEDWLLKYKDQDGINAFRNCEDIELFLEKKLLKAGFLKRSYNAPSILRCEYYFLHLSFQEFFTAHYIANSCVDFEGFIRKNEYKPYFNYVFYFTAGLLINNKEKLIIFFKVLLNKSKELFGLYTLLLSVRCYAEIEDCEDIEEIDNIFDIDSVVNELMSWNDFDCSLCNVNNAYCQEELNHLILNMIAIYLSYSRKVTKKIANVILAQYETASIEMKKYSISQIGKFRIIEESTVKLLVNALKDQNKEIRVEAAISLGELRFLDDNAIDMLVDAFEKGGTIYVRMHATRAFEKLIKINDKVISAIISYIERTSIYDYNENIVSSEVLNVSIKLYKKDKYFKGKLIERLVSGDIRNKIDGNWRELYRKIFDDRHNSLKERYIEGLMSGDIRDKICALGILYEHNRGVLDDRLNSLIEYIINNITKNDAYHAATDISLLIKVLGISKIIDNRIIDFIVNYLKDHLYLDDSILVFRKIGIRDDDVINALLNAFNGFDNIAKMHAAESLGKFGRVDEKIIYTLKSVFKYNGVPALKIKVAGVLESLNELEEEDIRAVVSVIKDIDTTSTLFHEPIDYTALKSLVKREYNIVKELLNYIKSRTSFRHVNDIISFFGNLDNDYDEVTDTLINIISGGLDKPFAKEYAIEALGLMCNRNKKVTDILVKIIYDEIDNYAYVYCYYTKIIKALGNCGAVEENVIADCIINCLEKRFSEVVTTAVEVLSKYDKVNSKTILIITANLRNQEIRTIRVIVQLLKMETILNTYKETKDARCLELAFYKSVLCNMPVYNDNEKIYFFENGKEIYIKVTNEDVEEIREMYQRFKMMELWN